MAFLGQAVVSPFACFPPLLNDTGVMGRDMSCGALLLMGFSLLAAFALRPKVADLSAAWVPEGGWSRASRLLALTLGATLSQTSLAILLGGLGVLWGLGLLGGGPVFASGQWAHVLRLGPLLVGLGLLIWLFTWKPRVTMVDTDPDEADPDETEAPWEPDEPGGHKRGAEHG